MVPGTSETPADPVPFFHALWPRTPHPQTRFHTDKNHHPGRLKLHIDRLALPKRRSQPPTLLCYPQSALYAEHEGGRLKTASHPIHPEYPPAVLHAQSYSHPHRFCSPPADCDVQQESRPLPHPMPPPAVPQSNNRSRLKSHLPPWQPDDTDRYPAS